MDCMEYMATVPNGFYDLIIADPPYGLGSRLSDGGGKLKNTPMAVLYRESTQWDVAPPELFFTELFRISKNQIIWGGNYFNLPPSRCMICWDKLQAMPTLSAWELGWTSFDKPSKIVKASSMDLNRFHPTAKPIKIYKWIYQNYLPNGGKVYDPMLGSGSNRIAADKAGNIDFYATEIDADYFNAQEKRWREYKAQAVLTFPDRIDPVQSALF